MTSPVGSVLVKPLVLVREHAGGVFSACPAADPSLVCYGSDREAVLDELRLFLSSYLAKAPISVVERLILPEEAALDEVKVLLPYGLARARRPRTTIGLNALFVPARRNRQLGTRGALAESRIRSDKFLRLFRTDAADPGQHPASGRRVAPRGPRGRGEMADAAGLGPVGGDTVGVQVPSPAPSAFSSGGAGPSAARVK